MCIDLCIYVCISDMCCDDFKAVIKESPRMQLKYLWMYVVQSCVATDVLRPRLATMCCDRCVSTLACDHVLRPRVEATALRPCVATVVLPPSRCDHGHQGHADAFAGALQLGEVISLWDLRRGILRLRGFQAWQLSMGSFGVTVVTLGYSRTTFGV